MQAAGVNALMALVTGNAAPARTESAADRAESDDHGADQQFAQLLNDSGMQSDGQGAQNTARGQFSQAGTSSILAAQEIEDVKSGAQVTRQLLPLHDQQVSPADAADIIKKIDDLIAQQGQSAQQDHQDAQQQSAADADTAAAAQVKSATDLAALAPLKEQMQAIVTSGTPKSLAEILNALPAVKQSKQAWAVLGSLFVGKAAPVKPPIEEAPLPASAVASAVPATLFRSHRADNAAAAAQAAAEDVSKKKKTSDVETALFLAQHVGNAPVATQTVAEDTVKKNKPNDAEIAALVAQNAASLSATMPITTVAPAAVPVPNTSGSDAQATADSIMSVSSATEASAQTAAPVEPMTFADIKSLANVPQDDQPAFAPVVPTTSGPLHVRADLDDAIPPLKLSDADMLPKIDLPEAMPAASEKSALATNQQVLNSGAVPFKAGDIAKETTTALNEKVVSANDITTTLNPSATGGHTATQSIHAVQPLSVASAATVAHTVINHAPVSDQVHVAINKAAKDGIDHITIQLDPIDMGRVEVQMHTNKEGQTHISFTVDKAETFDNLSRDARTLERSLQEAGIKADTGSMQFNMRQQSQQQQLHSNAGGQGQFQQSQAQPQQEEKSSSPSRGTPVASLTRNYQLNIREGVDISA